MLGTLLNRSSVSHGVPIPSPAVHCTVERLQTPVVGFHSRVSGADAVGAAVSWPGTPGVAGPARCSAWKRTSGAYQPEVVRHTPAPFS
jgi:hypothetical protein